MENKGSAFLKGGAGCLVAFIALALLALLFGGSAHLDFFGVLILFLIGGSIGLVVNWIYQKGKRDASGNDEDP